LRLPAGCAADSVHTGALLRLAQEYGIDIDDQVEAILREVAARFATHRRDIHEVICEGQPPRPGRAGCIERVPRFDPQRVVKPDPDADEAWEPETVEKKPDAGARKKRPPRKRSRRRKKPTEGADSSGDQSSDGPKEASGTSSNPDPAITAPPENHAPEHNQDDSDQPKPRPRKRPGRRRNKKSPSAETSPESTESTREEPGEAPEP